MADRYIGYKGYRIRRATGYYAITQQGGATLDTALSAKAARERIDKWLGAPPKAKKPKALSESRQRALAFWSRTEGTL